MALPFCAPPTALANSARFAALAGAYAEYLPVIHLVGVPSSGVQGQRRLVHHTLGNGEFGLFSRMAEPVVCAQAILTPENCVAESTATLASTARLIYWH
jgi:indolepyruvate decarboxylase